VFHQRPDIKGGGDTPRWMLRPCNGSGSDARDFGFSFFDVTGSAGSRFAGASSSRFLREGVS